MIYVTRHCGPHVRPGEVPIPTQLSAADAASATHGTDPYDVNHAWEGDNQDWWDWYLTLADNADSARERSRRSLALTAPSPMLPDHDLLAELQTPAPLTDSAIADFRENGFLKVKGVLSSGAVDRLRRAMKAILEHSFGVSLDGGVEGRYLSQELAWEEDRIIRAFVLAPRVAHLAAQLLSVPRVRLYHDNLMSKEPGAGRTPWHYDDHHFPLATDDVVTAWIPAQAVPRDMGPLSFARPLEAWQHVANIPFHKTDTSYDRRVAEVFRDRDVSVEDGGFDLGEVSFHHNRSFHTAGPNLTDKSRLVLATTYYADGARVTDRPTMVSGDWQKFIPATAPGDVAASHRNPVCWPPTLPLEEPAHGA